MKSKGTKSIKGKGNKKADESEDDRGRSKAKKGEENKRGRSAKSTKKVTIDEDAIS